MNLELWVLIKVLFSLDVFLEEAARTGYGIFKKIGFFLSKIFKQNFEFNFFYSCIDHLWTQQLFSHHLPFYHKNCVKKQAAMGFLIYLT